MSCAGIGSMNVLVTIIQKTPTPDNQGGRANAWATYATLWMSIKDKKGWEQIAGGQRTHKSHKILTGLWKSGITEVMRASFGGNTYNIVHVDNLEDKSKYVQLTAVLGEPL